MIIKILEDNTVHAIYPDGSSETINSTHAEKGRTAITRAVASALPYKGAMNFTADFIPPVFDSKTATIQAGSTTLTPDSDASEESPEVQALFNILYPNEQAPATRLYRARQQ